MQKLLYNWLNLHSAVTHVRLAAEHGLGIDDLARITVVGADLNEIKMKFEPSLGYKLSEMQAVHYIRGNNAICF